MFYLTIMQKGAPHSPSVYQIKQHQVLVKWPM